MFPGDYEISFIKVLEIKLNEKPTLFREEREALVI